MSECPNCGHNSHIGSSHCGCTWDEQIAAARIKEVRRRRKERREGKEPVVVDYQTSAKHYPRFTK